MSLLGWDMGDMNFDRLGDYLAVAVGTGLLVVFYSDASVMAGVSCHFEGTWGRVYELLGIYVPRVGFGVTLGPRIEYWMVWWNDGCNRHDIPLLLFVLAVGALTLGGLRIYRRHHPDSPT